MIAQSFMDIEAPTSLLGGLTPAAFMRRHWQKKPLLVRTALSDAGTVTRRAEMFGLAGRNEVESRLIRCDGERWSLVRGPFARRALPGLKAGRWTLLVQGADLHLEAAHSLLGRFRFIPDARFDDVMLSYATDGAGVGPHVDSYDVFLLQVCGRRRWSIARSRKAPRLRSDVPFKMLADFAPVDEWLLEPGDMLYLPPGWGHDGVADGETITASIGFRAPGQGSLALQVAQRLVDAAEPAEEERRYADRAQPATAEPARIPEGLRRFADAAVAGLLDGAGERARALGEVLSEPSTGAVFEPGGRPRASVAVRLDRRSRMVYDDRHVFINGEAYVAGGADARLVRCLADRRRLEVDEVAAMSAEARALLGTWLAAGWLVAEPARRRR